MGHLDDLIHRQNELFQTVTMRAAIVPQDTEATESRPGSGCKPECTAGTPQPPPNRADRRPLRPAPSVSIPPPNRADRRPHRDPGEVPPSGHDDAPAVIAIPASPRAAQAQPPNRADRKPPQPAPSVSIPPPNRADRKPPRPAIPAPIPPPNRADRKPPRPDPIPTATTPPPRRFRPKPTSSGSPIVMGTGPVIEPALETTEEESDRLDRQDLHPEVAAILAEAKALRAAGGARAVDVARLEGQIMGLGASRTIPPIEAFHFLGELDQILAGASGPKPEAAPDPGVQTDPTEIRETH